MTLITVLATPRFDFARGLGAEVVALSPSLSASTSTLSTSTRQDHTAREQGTSALATTPTPIVATTAMQSTKKAVDAKTGSPGTQSDTVPQADKPRVYVYSADELPPTEGAMLRVLTECEFVSVQLQLPLLKKIGQPSAASFHHVCVCVCVCTRPSIYFTVPAPSPQTFVY